MSTEYSDVTAKLISILDGEREDALSADLTVPVKSVNKGQYVPSSSGEKPIVFVRMRRAAIKRSMAGNLIRDERLKFVISGAVVAATQAIADSDADILINNIENLLEAHPSEDGYWSAGSLGWNFPADEEPGEDFVEKTPDPGTTGAVVHFEIYWACDVRIARETV